MRQVIQSPVPAPPEVSGQTQTPISPAASSILIPAIHKEVPYRYIDNEHPDLLELGKMMLRIGLPIENAEHKGVSAIITEAWDKQFDVLFKDAPDFASAIFRTGASGEPYNDFNIGEGEIGLFIDLDLTCADGPRVRNKIDAIHKMNPVVAWYFWSVLQDISKFLPILTPINFLGIVEHSQWMGESDETGVIESYLEDGVPSDEINVITLVDVMRTIRPWEIRACRANSISVRKRICMDAISDDLRVLVQELDAIHDISTTLQNDEFAKKSLCTSWYQFAVTPVLDDRDHGLWWQVMDDFYRGEMESDGDRYLAKIVFDPRLTGLELVSTMRKLGHLWSQVRQLFANHFGDTSHEVLH